MDTPIKPRPPLLKQLPDLPPQFLHQDAHLKIDKTLRGNKIRRLDKLAKEFAYFKVSYDEFDCATIELGNTIIPAGYVSNPSYAKALDRYNEIAYDNECRLAKYEQDMAKYREYVARYRVWYAAQKAKEAGL